MASLVKKKKNKKQNNSSSSSIETRINRSSQNPLFVSQDTAFSIHIALSDPLLTRCLESTRYLLTHS